MSTSVMDEDQTLSLTAPDIHTSHTDGYDTGCGIGGLLFQRLNKLTRELKGS